MTQDSGKPREYRAIFISEEDVIAGEIHNHEINGAKYVTLIEKRAFDRVVEALKKIKESPVWIQKDGTESPFNRHTYAQSSVEVAGQALKDVGVDV